MPGNDDVFFDQLKVRHRKLKVVHLVRIFQDGHDGFGETLQSFGRLAQALVKVAPGLRQSGLGRDLLGLLHNRDVPGNGCGNGQSVTKGEGHVSVHQRVPAVGFRQPRPQKFGRPGGSPADSRVDNQRKEGFFQTQGFGGSRSSLEGQPHFVFRGQSVKGGSRERGIICHSKGKVSGDHARLEFCLVVVRKDLGKRGRVKDQTGSGVEQQGRQQRRGFFGRPLHDLPKIRLAGKVKRHGRRGASAGKVDAELLAENFRESQDVGSRSVGRVDGSVRIHRHVGDVETGLEGREVDETEVAFGHEPERQLRVSGLIRARGKPSKPEEPPQHLRVVKVGDGERRQGDDHPLAGFQNVKGHGAAGREPQKFVPVHVPVDTVERVHQHLGGDDGALGSLQRSGGNSVRGELKVHGEDVRLGPGGLPLLAGALRRQRAGSSFCFVFLVALAVEREGPVLRTHVKVVVAGTEQRGFWHGVVDGTRFLGKVLVAVDEAKREVVDAERVVVLAPQLERPGKLQLDVVFSPPHFSKEVGHHRAAGVPSEAVLLTDGQSAQHFFFCGGRCSASEAKKRKRKE